MIYRDELAHVIADCMARGGGVAYINARSGDWLIFDAAYPDPGGEWIAVFVRGSSRDSPESQGDLLSRAYALADGAIERYEGRARFRIWLAEQGYSYY